MRYTTEKIQEELKATGWQVLPGEYKNLDTQLTFICPEGHRVYDSWRHIRNKQFCPTCAVNDLKVNDHKIVKKTSKKRVFALDQSSKITGYSIYDGDELIDYGVFETNLSDEIKRANQLRQWFISMCNNWKPDYIGIEGVQYQEKFGVTTFQTLCRVQGIIMVTCVELGLPYEVCPTNTWRHFCEVKGRSRADKKRSMQMLVKQWYDISVSDDESDAIGIGRYVAKAVVPKNDIVEWE